MSADPKPAQDSPRQELLAPGDVPGRGVLTPMDMLNQAVAQGANIDVLEKLMGLQERWERNQARKAFDAAIAAAKAEIPEIKKNKRVYFESQKAGARPTDYWHETLDEIARVVNPILAAHGLSYRFRSTSEVNEPITVTCILSHKDGHSEENTLRAGRDDSGNKNAIQQIGSTVTYLQRYTLKAALELAASGDDDGKAAGDDNDAITEEQAATLRALITETNSDLAAFCRFFKIETLPEMPAKRFDEAVRMIEAKRGAKK